jgi:hypothetical protein
MVSPPPQIPRNAERAQCEGRVALVVQEEQRGHTTRIIKAGTHQRITPPLVVLVAAGRIGVGTERRPRSKRMGVERGQ